MSKKHTPRELYLAMDCDEEDMRGNAENDTDLLDLYAPVRPGSKQVVTEVVATMVEGYTEDNAREIKRRYNTYPEAIRLLGECRDIIDKYTDHIDFGQNPDTGEYPRDKFIAKLDAFLSANRGRG